jgi:hypothetical protein
MKLTFSTLLLIAILTLSCSPKVETEHIQKQKFDSLYYPEQKVKLEEDEGVFGRFEDAKFKLDYYHNEGYSTGNRYWYEIIIIDSMVVLYFDSPQNDDWNNVHYHKSFILDENEAKMIKNKVKMADLDQKTEGFPEWRDWSGSGYGENRLIIESEDVNVAGGMIYNNIFNDDEDFESSISEDMKASSSISGNYESLFKELEKLFDSLPFLLEDKNRSY